MEEKSNKKRKINKSQEQIEYIKNFKDNLKIKWNNYYQYYFNDIEEHDLSRKINFYCKNHGKQSIKLIDHMNGIGCRECEIEFAETLYKINNKYNFIEAAQKIYGIYYDYSEVEFIDIKSLIKIKCPCKNYFICRLMDHLNFIFKKICPYCKGLTKLPDLPNISDIYPTDKILTQEDLDIIYSLTSIKNFNLLKE